MFDRKIKAILTHVNNLYGNVYNTEAEKTNVKNLYENKVHMMDLYAANYYHAKIYRTV